MRQLAIISMLIFGGCILDAGQDYTDGKDEYGDDINGGGLVTTGDEADVNMDEVTESDLSTDELPIFYGEDYNIPCPWCS